MKRTTPIRLTAFAAFTFPGLLLGHHSGSMYGTSPLWISGTVVQFEPSNPHTFTTLESRQQGGEIRRWIVEGPPQSRFGSAQAVRYVPAVGDVIGFCAFPYKPIEELARLFPETDYSSSRWSMTAEGSSPQLVTGHVMVVPDGEKQLWEPHGVIAACIRSSDEARQGWFDFLTDERNARQAWCQQKTYAVVRTDAALSEFVEAFDDLLDAPCGQNGGR